MSPKAKRLITQFANAVRADEMKGGGDPADIPEIEMHLQRTRERLNAYIVELERFQADGERALREGDWA
jgi:hypothetical protein